MIRYLANFGILAIYLLFFWVIIRSSRKVRIILLMAGFVAGACAALLVDLLYRLPYFDIRSFAPIVEEVCKFLFVFLFVSWSKLGALLLKDRNSIVLFGVMVGLYFAFLENLSWIQSFNINLDTVVKRGFISSPMHMVYTGCSAYGLAQTLMLKKKVYWAVLLAASILIHFLFNYYIAPAIH